MPKTGKTTKVLILRLLMIPFCSEVSTMTAFQEFCQRWKGGCGSALCSVPGTRVVLCRGTVPCDVLFVGEAPGESENVKGLPFWGPAGKLLDQVIEQAWSMFYPHSSLTRYEAAAYRRIAKIPTYALTNLVCCIPRDEDSRKASEPDSDSIDCCRPRLEEFIELANPRLIVAVGKLAEDYLRPGFKHSVCFDRRRTALVSMVHPAAILRANAAQQGLAVQRCVVTLQNAVEKLG